MPWVSATACSILVELAVDLVVMANRLKKQSRNKPFLVQDGHA
jgi:hypothetical protein